MPQEPVDSGARGDDVHYEPDAEQGVKARFTEKPGGPLPPEEYSGAVENGEPQREGPPIEDVAVAPPSSSVWDARPEDETR
jgi:hypothetical protein